TLLAATFVHDEAGLSALCRTLVRMEVGLVAIERPDGVLVERLLDAGLRVLALHPKKVAAARDRFRVSGGKSDHFDAPALLMREGSGSDGWRRFLGASVTQAARSQRPCWRSSAAPPKDGSVNSSSPPAGSSCSPTWRWSEP